MFPAITILVILVCAVPLCLGVGFAMGFGAAGATAGWIVGVGAFVISCTWLIRNLVLKNNTAH